MDKDYIIEKIVVGPVFTNCYLFACAITKACAVIDPGADSDLIKKRVVDLKLKPECVIITHGHFDHIGAVADFKLPVYAGVQDAECFSNTRKSLSFLIGEDRIFDKPDRLLKEKDVISVGNCVLEVIEVPGHTAGSICLLGKDILFSGDALFADSIGRTDFPGGNHNLLVKMIKEKLFCLDDSIKVYPGHGANTTIGKEKRSNPFIE
ncbi:MAG: MBL fold metallo-hydrolase [Candidatus Omnitrophota bacterium]